MRIGRDRGEARLVAGRAAGIFLFLSNLCLAFSGRRSSVEFRAKLCATRSGTCNCAVYRTLCMKYNVMCDF